MLSISTLVGFALLFLGVPIFLAFAVFGVWMTIYELQIPWSAVGISMYSSITKYVLVSIPLFILAATLMLHTGLSRRLVNFFAAWVGHWKGGLALVMVLSMGLFGAINGSILAAIIAIGTVLLPLMEERGYPRAFIAALAAGSAGLESLIPPSNVAIIYASITEVPVTHVFASTILIGIIQLIFLMIAVSWICRKMPKVPPLPWKERWRATYAGIPALLLPIIILGGIFGGIFTAVEAAAVACVYAILVGFVSRSLSFAGVRDAVRQTVSITAVIFIIIATASMLSIVLVYTQIPQKIHQFAAEQAISPITFLAFGAAGVLVLGTFLEAIPNLLVTASVLVPAAVALHIPFVWLYSVIAISVGLGLLTPPVCIGAYTAAGMADVPIGALFRYLYPWLFLPLILSLVLVTIFPQLSTWLPSLL